MESESQHDSLFSLQLLLSPPTSRTLSHRCTNTQAPNEQSTAKLNLCTNLAIKMRDCSLPMANGSPFRQRIDVFLVYRRFINVNCIGTYIFFAMPAPQMELHAAMKCKLGKGSFWRFFWLFEKQQQLRKWKLMIFEQFISEMILEWNWWCMVHPLLNRARKSMSWNALLPYPHRHRFKLPTCIMWLWLAMTIGLLHTDWHCDFYFYLNDRIRVIARREDDFIDARIQLQ